MVKKWGSKISWFKMTKFFGSVLGSFYSLNLVNTRLNREFFPLFDGESTRIINLTVKKWGSKISWFKITKFFGSVLGRFYSLNLVNTHLNREFFPLLGRV